MMPRFRSWSRALQPAAGVIEKGRLHAENEKFEPAVLLGMRLYPDMFPLSAPGAGGVRQCQGLHGASRGVWSRRNIADTESTFGELKSASTRRMMYVKSFDAAQAGRCRQPADGDQISRTVTLNFKSGWDYLPHVRAAERVFPQRDGL